MRNRAPPARFEIAPILNRIADFYDGPRTHPLALVTGASTGIGYELAKTCAENGFDLLVAADEPKIEAAARDFRKLGATVEADAPLWGVLTNSTLSPKGRDDRSMRSSPMLAVVWERAFSTRISAT